MRNKLVKRWGFILGVGLLFGCARFQSKPLSAARTAAHFDARTLTNADLRAYLATNHVKGSWPRSTWDLHTLTLVAFYYHPDLAVARAQWALAQAGEITAGERPNPSVSVTPGYDAGIPDNPSPWLIPLSVDWPIETAGKRGYRIAVARHQAEAARWKLVGALWQARSAVRMALLNLYESRQSESLLARQDVAQSNVVHLLEGQFAVGNVSSFEVTQAHVALDSTRMAWQQAVGQVQQARVQLARALGLPERAVAGVHLALKGFTEFPEQLTRPEVRRQALLNRADVRSALADYAASQSSLQLQIASQYPDLHLGPGYAWNAGSAGDSEWDLGLTLTLPILNQNQGPIAEAKAQRAVAAATFEAVQAQAIGQINSALVAYKAALKQVATAQRLLKNLQRRLNSVRAQVEAGEAEPLALANAEVEFNTGAQSQLTARLQAQQALGQLEDATQSPLTLSTSALHIAQAPVNPQ